ncbi:PE-PPE domain-containing protein [Mycolicibacterium palauense]|uniref:PE-PPE domain-containing protein n=1 Tax=Mycolicibacterium palauense TaxID=2034511 RepID=UPI000BFEE1A8|nr:PE-PPE domain-containing protein [Mycolicibacterium palauense]
MATVITIPGAYVFGYHTDNFGGKLFEAPNVRVPGAWNNFSISDSSATTDMNNLDALMRDHLSDTADPLIVAGHSRGGQIIYKWIRQKGPTSDIDPESVLFISSGNPERKYGGRAYMRPDVNGSTYPGPSGGGAGVGYGILESTPYTVLDINRQYDTWADYPNDWENPDALAQLSGDIHSTYSATPELGLDGYPVNRDEWSVYTEGNVTYLTAVTMLVNPADRPMPFLARVFGGRCARNHNLQIGFDDQRIRTKVETAYVRPAPVLIPAKYR